ncbi:hypothetical protein BJV77DRAFT_1033923 [Russula vinacea]|nr:hypothetical protein BJV77DRAFT_1033923 [Russula vinacea]
MVQLCFDSPYSPSPLGLEQRDACTIVDASRASEADHLVIRMALSGWAEAAQGRLVTRFNREPGHEAQHKWYGSVLLDKITAFVRLCGICSSSPFCVGPPLARWRTSWQFLASACGRASMQIGTRGGEGAIKTITKSEIRSRVMHEASRCRRGN